MPTIQGYKSPECFGNMFEERACRPCIFRVLCAAARSHMKGAVVEATVLPRTASHNDIEKVLLPSAVRKSVRKVHEVRVDHAKAVENARRSDEHPTVEAVLSDRGFANVHGILSRAFSRYAECPRGVVYFAGEHEMCRLVFRSKTPRVVWSRFVKSTVFPELLDAGKLTRRTKAIQKGEQLIRGTREEIVGLRAVLGWLREHSRELSVHDSGRA